MATLLIRNLDDAVKRSLRLRAAQHGVSMEEEARRILRDALSQTTTSPPLGERLRNRFAEVADQGFTLPGRTPSRIPPGWMEEE